MQLSQSKFDSKFASEVKMLTGYLNYPNSQVTAHGNISCGDIRKMHKTSQRNIRIDQATFSNELQRFIREEHHFGSEPNSNDMWLEIDFGDPAFELAVFDFIHRLLGNKYKPFHDTLSTQHCTG